ncbi:thermonuclease family protein, partial [Conchiformibius steedae]
MFPKLTTRQKKKLYQSATSLISAIAPEIFGNFTKPTARQKKKLYQSAAALISAAVLAIFGISQGPSNSKNYSGTVTAVTDGDTVRITDHNGQKQRIRMAFIDAPESSQSHGKASQAALKQMVEGKQVRVEVIDTDQYQRQVARLRINGE